MNLHVVVVHFPVALLTLYGLLELIPWRRIRDLPYMFYLKAFCVILGSGSAAVSVKTGEFLAEKFNLSGQLIKTHEFFGESTLYFFGMLSLIYLVSFLKKSGWDPLPKVSFYVDRFLSSWLMLVFGLVGLVLITITGALGGAMAFGPDTDPLARFVYNLFGF